MRFNLWFSKVDNRYHIKNVQEIERKLNLTRKNKNTKED